MLRMLVIPALSLGLVLGGCARSAEEQKNYDLGYEYADAMIDELGLTDEDAIYDGCGVLAREMNLVPKSDLANAMGDGCWDRLHETTP